MQPERYYKPREIARLGLIKNTVNSDIENSNYDYVLDLIDRGLLRAKNVGKGKKRPVWLVPESAIREYHATIAEVA